ncbi:hypothetical protein LXL04_013857 [Taraxacum kok-saghyz]
MAKAQERREEWEPGRKGSICVTSFVCAAQTTRRHKSLQISSPPSRFNSRCTKLIAVFSTDRRVFSRDLLLSSIADRPALLSSVQTVDFKPQRSISVAIFSRFQSISADFNPISPDFFTTNTEFLHYMYADFTPISSPDFTRIFKAEVLNQKSNFSILFGKLSILYVVFWLLAMGEKHQWSNDQIKCLLETCIEEVNTIGRKGLSLHKDSWNKVGRVLKDNFGVDLTKKQLKNSYDNLKAKYTGWIYLKNKTGNLYNPQTNTFNLTAEEWDEF